MRKRFYVIFLVSWFVLLAGLVHGQNSDKKTIKVLFVGNSYTYFWNLPQTVETMVNSGGFEMIARQSTAGGTNWKQHWEGDKNLKTKQLIENGDWDVVVLQNHSESTIKDMNEFMSYGDKLIELVKRTGAQPVLYETWAREFNPLMMKTIKEGYHQLAEKHQISILHIGEIWDYAKNQRADIRLYDPDMSHPSTIGTYLTACYFYTFFTKQSATAINHRISKKDENGEPLYLSIMSEENAAFLQQVVDRFNEEVVDE